MRQRGRKSSLSIIATIDEARPVPPPGMSEAETEIFYDVARRLPAGYFPPETWETLAAYARHAVAFRDLSVMCNNARRPGNPDGWDFTLDALERVLKMREKEGRCMLAFARSLRLTNQSRFDPKTASRQASGGGQSAYDLQDLWP